MIDIYDNIEDAEYAARKMCTNISEESAQTIITSFFKDCGYARVYAMQMLNMESMLCLSKNTNNYYNSIHCYVVKNNNWTILSFKDCPVLFKAILEKILAHVFNGYSIIAVVYSFEDVLVSPEKNIEKLLVMIDLESENGN